MKKGRKDISRLRLSIDDVGNVEPNKVEWKNMVYIRCERNIVYYFL